MKYENNEDIQVTVIHHIDCVTLQRMKIRIWEECYLYRYADSWSVYDDMQSNRIYLIYREFPHKRLIDSVNEYTKEEIFDYIKQILTMILTSDSPSSTDTNSLETLIDHIVPDIKYPIHHTNQLTGEPKAKIPRFQSQQQEEQNSNNDRIIGLLNFRPDNIYVDQKGKIFINQFVPNDPKLFFIAPDTKQSVTPYHIRRLTCWLYLETGVDRFEDKLEFMYKETLYSLYWLLKILTECDNSLDKLDEENRRKMLGDQLTREEKRIENLTKRFVDNETVYLLKKLIDYCRNTGNYY